MEARDAAAVLIRKLETITVLSSEERDALFGLPMQIKTIGPDQDIVQEGNRPSQSCLLIEGFLCRYKVTSEGRRQIHSFHIPGDMPDLQSLHLRVLDHSVGTLTASKVGFISHEDLHALCAKHASLATAFWRDTLVDAAIFREWITNVGRRTAYQRIAHILCEILARLSAVGLAQGNTFELPVTQAELGDATGLSTVHVNRTLQELKAGGLITMQNGLVTVENWDELKAAGEFDPLYLHLKSTQAA